MQQKTRAVLSALEPPQLCTSAPMNRNSLDKRLRIIILHQDGDCTLRQEHQQICAPLAVTAINCSSHCSTPHLQDSKSTILEDSPRPPSPKLPPYHTTTLRSPTRPCAFDSIIPTHSHLHDIRRPHPSFAPPSGPPLCDRLATVLSPPGPDKHSYTCILTPHHPAVGRLSTSFHCTAQ
jgi:hypothetical protein